jgi:transcriptional regulator with XRE-family HTH domain
MELADRIGVSYQQVQKYEKDRSRITLERLYLIARALDAPLKVLIPEFENRPLSDKGTDHGSAAAIPRGLTREERQLLRLYAKIESAQLRRTVLRLVENIVEQQHG